MFKRFFSYFSQISLQVLLRSTTVLMSTSTSTFRSTSDRPESSLPVAAVRLWRITWTWWRPTRCRFREKRVKVNLNWLILQGRKKCWLKFILPRVLPTKGKFISPVSINSSTKQFCFQVIQQPRLRRGQTLQTWRPRSIAR